MDNEEEWRKLYEKWGKKDKDIRSVGRKSFYLLVIFLSMITFSFIFVLIFNLFSSPFVSNFVLVENLKTFNSTDYSIRLEKVPKGNNCEIFVSGNGRIKFFGNYSCSFLSEKRFRVAEILRHFEGQSGDYIIFVISDLNESSEMEFRVLPRRSIGV